LKTDITVPIVVGLFWSLPIIDVGPLLLLYYLSDVDDLPYVVDGLGGQEVDRSDAVAPGRGPPKDLFIFLHAVSMPHRRLYSRGTIFTDGRPMLVANAVSSRASSSCRRPS
jgi:hypothetical protein